MWLWLYFRRIKPIKYLIAFLIYLYYKIFRSSKRFVFRGKAHPYFYHMYNFTFLAERAVEIPIFWEQVKKYQGKEILEVGNVLSHYFPVEHDIVDKYEKEPGVINQDIVDFKPGKKYDLIVAISTLEHVGWDERPRKHKKFVRALENLKKLQTKRGKIMMSLPLGYNPHVDILLAEGKLGLKRKFCLKRISKDNTWRQVSWKEIENAKYSDPFLGPTGLVIGII